MNKDKLNFLAQYIRKDKDNQLKKSLIEFMQEKICKYSYQENTPAEQIKGMNRILKDIIDLPDKMFGDK